MLTCNLCGDWNLFGSFCKECQDIRRILLIVGKKNVYDSVRRLYISFNEPEVISKVDILNNELDGMNKTMVWGKGDKGLKNIKSVKQTK